ncbi:hypothetical protein O3P69_014488 [Scylla paramamosain]|uniref:Uncharacterized protein n=1 Tax=Scylla paramamosain TaxID=85552 RepID=A0AAW0TCF3_SCYPA
MSVRAAERDIREGRLHENKSVREGGNSDSSTQSDSHTGEGNDCERTAPWKRDIDRRATLPPRQHKRHWHVGCVDGLWGNRGASDMRAHTPRTRPAQTRPVSAPPPLPG